MVGRDGRGYRGNNAGTVEEDIGAGAVGIGLPLTEGIALHVDTQGLLYPQEIVFIQ